tara:strand:+ start:19561 stop:20043 length:483 start_codon:yes stop_codon:yes gene_type:complete
MIRGLLFLGGLGVAGYGVYRYYTKQLAILQDSDISLLNVKLINQTKTNVTLRFNLKVINKSEQDFTIKDFKSNVYFNNKLIGDIEALNINKLILSNGGTTLVSFDYSLNPTKIGLAEILGGLFANKLKSNLSLRGRMKIKKGFVTLDSPVDIDYTLKELF